MTEPELEATDHLRTIRALMERATVYRAISAPAALAAGTVTLAVCGILAMRAPVLRPDPGQFLALWLAVLAAVTFFNFWLLHRNAKQRGEDFASSGMRMALQAVSPPLASGFALSALYAYDFPGAWSLMVSFWMLFYGLALLAMRAFAPRSLVRLGYGFFLLGIFSFFPGLNPLSHWGPFRTGLCFMALSFGLLHIVYAVAVIVFRSPHSPQPEARPDGSA